MLAYILRRLVWIALTLWGVSLLTFGLIFAGPSDPAQALVGNKAGAAWIRLLREQLGLDRPAYPSTSVTWATWCGAIWVSRSTSIGRSARRCWSAYRRRQNWRLPSLSSRSRSACHSASSRRSTAGGRWTGC